MLNFNLKAFFCLGALWGLPVAGMSQSWNFVDGKSVPPIEKKNLGPQPLIHMSKSEHGLVNGAVAVLPKGEAVSALQQHTQLKPGFYDVEATVSTSSLGAVCYLYGKGQGYTMGATLVPAGEKVKVRVSGVGTADGNLLVGVYSDGSQQVEVSDLKIQPAQAANFLQGGDITELNYVLDNGGRYADENGKTLCDDLLSREEMAQNVLNYMAQNGLNFVRIRLTNNPGRPDHTNTYYLPEGYQDESDCLQLAKMANEAGMDIQFTFNWSDYWSNGTRQNVPADWLEAVKKAGSGKEVETLANCAYNYTKKVMQNLASLNIYPAYVSLGNETNGGFLFPYAYAYDVPAADATADMPQGYKNWGAIAKVVNAGYNAVKEVSPNSQVVVHLADNTYDVVDKAEHVDWWVYSWYFDELKKAGAKFDVIGASYYPSWSTATAAQAARFYTQLINRYNKDVLVMETGYNWTEKRKDGHDGQLPYTAPDYKTRFPFSKEGQRGFLADVLNELKAVRSAGGHRVVGDLYWDPMMIHVEDQWGKNATGWANWWQWKTPDVNVVENTTLFDFDGRALPAFDAYRYNRNSLPLKAYTLTAADDLSVDLEKACYGDSVTVNWSAMEGYKVDSLTIHGPEGQMGVLAVADTVRNLKFEMPDNDVTIVAHRSKTTPTTDLLVTCESPIAVTAQKGALCLLAAVNAEVDVYTAAGALVCRLVLQANEPKRCTLAEGVYVVDNRKYVVR